MTVRRRLLMALLIASLGRVFASPARALAAACCGPVTASGARLVTFLDGSGVDHLWLPGFKVNWQTGAAISAWADRRPHTHCSAFVASIAMRLGIYVLRPPEHSVVLLANAQMAWLRSAAAMAEGWVALPDVAEAQTRANQGDLVLAAFENPDPDKPGHIAIVRPSNIEAATLVANGPFITQAGAHNTLSAPLDRGFAGHRGAWIDGGRGSVRFFAHSIALGAFTERLMEALV
jgi:hypothetical protein